MIRYKIDVLAELKSAGISTYKIRKDKIFNETLVQNIRRGKLITWDALNTICKLLNCQPGDIIEYVPD